tara:strand:- start:447 stop:830 length:384 start_codon:yes stop_codon:yes gene_type:complete
MKYLLPVLCLFIFSCDDDNDSDNIITSVCGYDDFEYLSGYGGSTSPYGVEGLATIADGYCEMAGYTSAFSYDVNSTGPVQNVLNIGCTSTESIPENYSCDNVAYCNGTGNWGVANGQFPVIYNLICE